MKLSLKYLVILSPLSTIPLHPCTTTIITKGANKDGSVFVAHSDDSEMFDNRLVYIPTADHKLGSMRPVYYDVAALGDRPEYNTNALRRYVGTYRGDIYVDDDISQSIPHL